MPVTLALPVVTCPTTFALSTPPSTSAPLPTSEEVSVPGILATELAVYSDTDGLMMLLAPKGWTCSAAYGADGGGGVAVYPPGESIPQSAFGAGWALSPGSSSEAVVGSQTSACQGCEMGQACPLFTIASSDYQSSFGRACPKNRPALETVDEITAGVVVFEDPPGVTGDGNPSGGKYSANGVMTYYSKSDNGSWIDTCTLPEEEKALCKAALNDFIDLYGQK